MKFIPFYFEGNEWWGHFNTPKEVIDLLNSYDYEFLRKARIHNRTNHNQGDKGNQILNDKPCFGFYSEPCFGFYSEYNGNQTFGEWIDKNKQGMYFDIKKERQLKLEKFKK